MLFLASDHARSHSELRRMIGADPTVPIAGTDLQQLAWNIAPDNWFSIGLRPTRLGGASYEQVGGRKVETALPEDRLFARALGHGMAGGGNGSFGFSVAKAKLWEPESNASLLAFRDWCRDRAGQLRQVAADRQGLPGLPGVAIGRRFTEFPAAPVLVVSADYARLAFDFEFLDGSNAPIPVDELELLAQRDSDITLQLELQRMGETIWLGVQEPSGKVSSLAADVTAVRRSTGELVELHELFEEETPTILFTDGTSVVASTLTEAQIHHRPVDPAVLIHGSWDGVSVTTEIGQSSEGMPGVQEALASQLADRCQLVLTDHGSRELADLIALTIASDASVRLELVHCKAAHAGGPRRRLEDIAEVLDQAARSARWADPASQIWAELLARLDRRAGCVFLHDPRGDGRARLQGLVDRPPAIEATIYAVQPGLDLPQVQDWEAGEALINLTVAWCRLVGGADFRLLGA